MVLGNQFQCCSTANLRRERGFGRKNSGSIVYEKNLGLYLKIMGRYIAKTPSCQVPLAERSDGLYEPKLIVVL